MNPCPFAQKLCGLLPKFPFAHWKEFWTILEFASLQTQNSPCGLRHWFYSRFASPRMVSQNSLMFAPGNQGNNLVRNAPFLVDYAQEQRCSRRTPETPVNDHRCLISCRNDLWETVGFYIMFEIRGKNAHLY